MDDRRKTMDESKLIPLTQGKFAIVDAADYERLAEHKWCLKSNNVHYYAHRSVGRTTIMMHHEIIDVPPGKVCDHINHNGLDNRRCNLRVCTTSQNGYNRLPNKNGTSRYKGVRWHKDACKWVAEICYKNHQIHIGYFDYEEDAAIAYDDMAIKLFGEFACLNYHCRPEIKQWLQDCYLFPPHETENISSDKSLSICNA